MKGIHLRFYTYENRKHDGMLLYEWLLEYARKEGIHGGSAFRAMAGFGRHGRLHEQHFFELAGEVPVLVEFLVDAEHADRLLADLRAQRLDVFYSRIASEFGALIEMADSADA
jgi:PII-like signaling protein